MWLTLLIQVHVNPYLHFFPAPVGLILKRIPKYHTYSTQVFTNISIGHTMLEWKNCWSNWFCHAASTLKSRLKNRLPHVIRRSLLLSSAIHFSMSKDHIMIPFIKIITVSADQLVLNQYKLPLLITAASCMPKLQILAFGQKYACTIC